MNQEHRLVIQRLLGLAGITPEAGALIPLSGDGSDRPFVRVLCGDSSYLAAFPSPTLAKARAEAHAAYMIGRHLAWAGIPVPAIVAYDPESCAILFEDLGGVLLYDAFHGGDEGAFDLYRKAVTLLADFQLLGLPGFDAGWCWDTARYDRELMITRESNYFAREFCGRFMGIDVMPAGLDREFAVLAGRIDQTPATGLMHRDYQSRNLMVVGDDLRIIDFQGARFGPLAYDLASLLNDPYVSLAAAEKSALTAIYLDRVAEHISLDRTRFIEEYHHIALQRNLQVLGAYAFLFKERGKLFFKDYIDPALHRLEALLAGTLAGVYPTLQSLVDRICAARRNA